jgi:hypothetical protein
MSITKINPQEIVKQLLDPKAYQEEQKKKEELRKVAEAKKVRLDKEGKKVVPVEKIWYDVKIEALLPATLIYRVLAENPQQAAELIKGKSPTQVQHRLAGAKNLALRIYNSGSTMLQFLKRF